MPRLKVLFIVPRLQRAGAEIQLVNLVNGLPAERFEKYLLSYRSGDDLNEDVNLGEVSLHQLRRRGRLDVSVGREIANIIDVHTIDIVHCTLQNALLFGYMGTRFARRKPKLFVSIHTTKNADIRLDIADQLVYRPLLKRCDSIWFVSVAQAELWIQRMPFISNKFVTIHNGIDLDQFDPSRFRSHGKALRSKLGISEKEKVVCCIAGLRPEKEHSVLLDAVQQCRAQGMKFRLLLAGSGPMESALRVQVKDLNLQNCVEFLGSLADVRAVLAASDCKVLISKAETFSIAMLEAMAMEVPVIMTSVGGACEAIDCGTSGYLLEPGNPSELASRLGLLLSDDDRRIQMGKEARRIVSEKFSVERMVDRSAENLH